MKRSTTVPTSVHSLRPADIDIVAAMGDSLTAGNGAGAEGDDELAVAIQFRDILKKFNPNLLGYSVRTGSANVWETAHLNAGVPGAHSEDMPQQAGDLARRMREHPELDYLNHWKLVHIFIGINDICRFCFTDNEDGDHYVENVRQGVQYLKENLPRTIVILSGMYDASLLRRLDHSGPFCKPTPYPMGRLMLFFLCIVGNYLIRFECKCEQNATVTDAELHDISRDYMGKMWSLQDSGEFESDDFTLIIQPYLEHAEDVGRNPDGTPNMDFFAPDCFHFSAYGHAILARNLWNNMMQSVGAKTAANLTDNGESLLCPDKACPFIRTTKNSEDCTKYNN
ncbi:hypothetical protein PRIPAC_73527 [Pristionchus pacificus]|uniref:Phospholipase B1, membrane-associated n=1 Tax=Pristionchus pacificus TaxID=54126 RepID=A0A2A6C563_PRIPA|nr:hypothetical protein PRIPAC_73527 [Pristionchus pacificus]|eukprot:PDM73315.1 lipase [Pristionchus pacificus]